MTTYIYGTTIELESLVVVLLALCGAVALVALAIVLFRLMGTLSKVNRVLDDLSPGLKNTVDQLPETVQQVNAAVGNVVDVTDAIADTVPELLGDVAKITATGSDTVVSVAGLVQSLADFLSNLVDQIRKPVEVVTHVAKTVRTVSGLLSKKSAGGAKKRGKKSKRKSG